MKNLLKNILLISMITAIGGVQAYADTEVEQVLQTSVQPVVSIDKTSSVEEGTVFPQTGIHTGLNAVFTLQSNDGTDRDYDFIVTSSILTADGAVSAFSKDGSLLFGSVTNPPSTTAVNNAKLHGSNNPNVVVYPITSTTTAPITSIYQENYKNYGNCYIILLHGGTEGTLTQTIGTNPVSGTYSPIEDEAGTYRATVIFSAFSK